MKVDKFCPKIKKRKTKKDEEKKNEEERESRVTRLSLYSPIILLLHICLACIKHFVNKAANTAGHCSHCTWKNKLRFIVGEIVEGFEICDARSIVRLSNVCRVSLSPPLPSPSPHPLYRFSSTNSPVCGKYRWDQPRRPRVSTCRVRVREELTPEFCTLPICFDMHAAWWFAKWFKIWEIEIFWNESKYIYMYIRSFVDIIFEQRFFKIDFSEVIWWSKKWSDRKYILIFEIYFFLFFFGNEGIKKNITLSSRWN